MAVALKKASTKISNGQKSLSDVTLKSMRFSIVTVTKNNLKGLKRTHKSLGAQTCRDYEWIVVDGASKDGTQNYLAGTNAIWVSANDKGIYDAMNRAIPEASGDYVLFLNAGDLLAGPWVLDRLTQEITAHRKAPGFLYGDSLETRPGEKHAPKRSRYHKTFRRGMFTHHQAMLYRREPLQKMRYDIQYRIAADYDLTCRFLRLKKMRSAYIPLPICIFESGGVSQQRADIGRREQSLIRKKLRLCDPVSNAAITAWQRLAWDLRQKYPKIYHGVKARI
jgi:putative colanic acid biosynthesis glycosyltransferase